MASNQGLPSSTPPQFLLHLSLSVHVPFPTITFLHSMLFFFFFLGGVGWGPRKMLKLLLKQTVNTANRALKSKCDPTGMNWELHKVESCIQLDTKNQNEGVSTHVHARKKNALSAHFQWNGYSCCLKHWPKAAEIVNEKMIAKNCLSCAAFTGAQCILKPSCVAGTSESYPNWTTRELVFCGSFKNGNQEVYKYIVKLAST